MNLFLAPPIALFSLLLAFSPAAAAPGKTVVKTQAPCANPCSVIDTAGAVVTVRSLRFRAPGKGTAVVTFSGSYFCTNGGGTLAFVELNSQIMDATGIPTSGAPGSLTYVKSLEPPNILAKIDSFNLASSRAFKITSGERRTFRLRVHADTLPANVECQVLDAALTVTFYPK